MAELELSYARIASVAQITQLPDDRGVPRRMAKAAEEFKGWAGMLRRALGGADIPQAREALRQMGGRITLRLHTERGERRALRPDQTLDGKKIKAGKWEDTYYVAHFEHAPGELPLHPVLAAEWFRAAAEIPSIGSGGTLYLSRHQISERIRLR